MTDVTTPLTEATTDASATAAAGLQEQQQSMLKKQHSLLQARIQVQQQQLKRMEEQLLQSECNLISGYPNVDANGLMLAGISNSDHLNEDCHVLESFASKSIASFKQDLSNDHQAPDRSGSFCSNFFPHDDQSSISHLASFMHPCPVDQQQQQQQQIKLMRRSNNFHQQARHHQRMAAGHCAEATDQLDEQTMNFEDDPETMLSTHAFLPWNVASL